MIEKMNEIIGESSKSSVCGGNKGLDKLQGSGANDGEGISATVAKVLQDYDWSVVPMVTK